MSNYTLLFDLFKDRHSQLTVRISLLHWQSIENFHQSVAVKPRANFGIDFGDDVIPNKSRNRDIKHVRLWVSGFLEERSQLRANFIPSGFAPVD